MSQLNYEQQYFVWNKWCEFYSWTPVSSGLTRYHYTSIQVRSGQVRVFNVHFQSKLL